MSVKQVAKLGGSVVGAGAAARRLAHARQEHDRLRMLDAVITLLSLAVTVAIVIREMRGRDPERSRVVELEDAE